MELVSTGNRSWRLTTRQFLPLPPEQAFVFFEDPRNLADITPPWLNFRMQDLSRTTVWEGAEFDYTIRWLIFFLPWRTRIVRYLPPVEFVDYQLRSPYCRWVHHHGFREENGGTVMTDQVDLTLPALALPFWPLVRLQLLAIFRYRARCVEAWVQRVSTGDGGRA